MGTLTTRDAGWRPQRAAPPCRLGGYLTDRREIQRFRRYLCASVLEAVSCSPPRGESADSGCSRRTSILGPEYHAHNSGTRSGDLTWKTRQIFVKSPSTRVLVNSADTSWPHKHHAANGRQPHGHVKPGHRALGHLVRLRPSGAVVRRRPPSRARVPGAAAAAVVACPDAVRDELRAPSRLASKRRMGMSTSENRRW
jgi:hypothetical protein